MFQHVLSGVNLVPLRRCRAMDVPVAVIKKLPILSGPDTVDQSHHQRELGLWKHSHIQWEPMIILFWGTLFFTEHFWRTAKIQLPFTLESVELPIKAGCSWYRICNKFLFAISFNCHSSNRASLMVWKQFWNDYYSPHWDWNSFLSQKPIFL